MKTTTRVRPALIICGGSFYSSNVTSRKHILWTHFGWLSWERFGGLKYRRVHIPTVVKLIPNR